MAGKTEFESHYNKFKFNFPTIGLKIFGGFLRKIRLYSQNHLKWANFEMKQPQLLHTFLKSDFEYLFNVLILWLDIASIRKFRKVNNQRN